MDLRGKYFRSGGAEMATHTHAPSGVPSRPGVWLGGKVKRFNRSQITAHNANAYTRRVAAKGARGGAQPVMHPCGQPVIGGVPAGVSRPPVNGVAPAGAGRPPVNEGAASDSRSREIAVLMAMQAQMRVMLRTSNRLAHEKTTATAAAARRSAAGEALREHRPA
jgi:hypothetical protein